MNAFKGRWRYIAGTGTYRTPDNGVSETSLKGQVWSNSKSELFIELGYAVEQASTVSYNWISREWGGVVRILF